jgi:hypothetical protein
MTAPPALLAAAALAAAASLSPVDQCALRMETNPQTRAIASAVVDHVRNRHHYTRADLVDAFSWLIARADCIRTVGPTEGR